MKRVRGSLVIGRWRGAPVGLHWTVPVGMLLFTRLQWVPAAWVGFLSLVAVHELGHAWMVRRFDLRVQAIEVTGFGGVCRWAGDASQLQESWIATAGVLAQLLILLPIGVALALFGPATPWSLQLADVLVWTNLWLVAINLLPIPPLDGVNAWKLPRRLRWSRQRRAAVQARRARRPDAVEPERPQVDGKPDPELMAEVQAILDAAAKRTDPSTDA